LVRCDSLPSVQLAFWATDCCGSSARLPLQPATCPILDSAYNKQVESNTIRIRRDVSFNDTTPRTNEITDDNTIDLLEEPGFKLKQLEETLSKVATTVNQLKDRIQELQEKCDKDPSPDESLVQFVKTNSNSNNNTVVDALP